MELDICPPDKNSLYLSHCNIYLFHNSGSLSTPIQLVIYSKPQILFCRILPYPVNLYPFFVQLITIALIILQLQNLVI